VVHEIGCTYGGGEGHQQRGTVRDPHEGVFPSSPDNDAVTGPSVVQNV
jgi:hypothetical protein